MHHRKFMQSRVRREWPKSFLSVVAALVSSAMLTSNAAFAQEPPEQRQVEIIRQAPQDQVLPAQFSRNFYRTESYTEQEAYTVQVPYQTTETYTDYEQYQTSEWICRDYVDYEYRCESRRECWYPQPFSGQVLDSLLSGINLGESKLALSQVGSSPLRERPPRYPEPGNPERPPERQPEPPPERERERPPQYPDPSPRPSPYPEPSPQPPPYYPPAPPPREPVCQERLHCENVPINRQRCGYETVTRTRPVERTRTVTRYRTETRYREVVRTRQVYDRTQTLAVQIEFSSQAKLLPGETERLFVSITGSESQPQVDVQFASQLFRHSSSSQVMQNGVLRVSMTSLPLYTETEASEASVSGLVSEVDVDAKLVQVNFRNLIQHPRVTSTAKVMLYAEGQVEPILVSDELVISQLSNVRVDLPLLGFENTNLRGEVFISRSGSDAIAASGNTNFRLPFVVEGKLRWEDLADETRVSAEFNRDEGVGTLQIQLTDKTQIHSAVSTQYLVSLVGRGANGKGRLLATSPWIGRAAQTDQRLFLLSLARFKVASGVNLESEITSGSAINIVVEVRRKLKDQAEGIQFWRNNGRIVP